jgi:hypothetical protein
MMLFEPRGLLQTGTLADENTGSLNKHWLAQQTGMSAGKNRRGIQAMEFIRSGGVGELAVKES